MSYEMHFLQALVLTALLEGAVLLAALRWLFRVGPACLPTWKALAAALACTALTLPYVWFLLPGLGLPHLQYLALSEGLAVLAEAGLLMGLLGLRPKSALACSLLCNSFSALAGSFLIA
ncbi:MAG: hypothetical protein AB7E32_00590 [Desulfovibrio sp.]